MKILQFLGFAPSKSDERLNELVKNSYSSIQVVGRGTIKISPKEVRQSNEFKKAQKLAKQIVES